MRRAALGLGLLLCVNAAPARADLAGDVERLTLAWSAFGRVKRLPPRLLERGDVVPLLLPADATDPTTRGCVTVAIVAPTTVNFVTDFYGLPREAVLGYQETLYPEYRKKIRGTYRQPPPCQESCGQAGNFVRRRAG